MEEIHIALLFDTSSTSTNTETQLKYAKQACDTLLSKHLHASLRFKYALVEFGAEVQVKQKMTYTAQVVAQKIHGISYIYMCACFASY